MRIENRVMTACADEGETRKAGSGKVELKMRHGFVKVAAATPDIRVADVEYNTEQICRAIDQAYEKGAKIVAFPELCVTGYTCGDLFYAERFG